jgi:hypothetical protein
MIKLAQNEVDVIQQAAFKLSSLEDSGVSHDNIIKLFVLVSDMNREIAMKAVEEKPVLVRAV